MPNENTVFTPSSILFRPHQKPFSLELRLPEWFLVEAPGTAPGSDRFITQVVYRHSRTSRQTRYNASEWRFKGKFECVSADY